MAAALAVGTGCGSERTGGPRGSAEQVVGRSVGRTIAAGTARFEVGAPRVKVEGVVDFEQGRVEIVRPADVDLPEASDPVVALALLRGVVDVVSYGGQAIRGTSTFRYELDIAPDKAVEGAPADRRAALAAVAEAAQGTLFADLWVDAEGRVRRIQVPLDPATPRPRGEDRYQPAYLTVDLFDFGTEMR